MSRRHLVHDLNSTRIAQRSPWLQLGILDRVFDLGTLRWRDTLSLWWLSSLWFIRSHIQTNRLATIWEGVSSPHELYSSLFVCGLCHRVVFVRVSGLRKAWRVFRSAGSFSGPSWGRHAIYFSQPSWPFSITVFDYNIAARAQPAFLCICLVDSPLIFHLSVSHSLSLGFVLVLV